MEEWEDKLKQSHPNHRAFISGVLQEVNCLIVKVSQGEMTLPSVADIKLMQKEYHSVICSQLRYHCVFDLFVIISQFRVVHYYYYFTTTRFCTSSLVVTIETKPAWAVHWLAEQAWGQVMQGDAWPGNASATSTTFNRQDYKVHGVCGGT